MYNKLFTKILDSSIWLESMPTRIVWLTLLAVMDQDGFAHFAALGNLAARARVTTAEAKKAVKILESPDDQSGDPDHEGRRIERVPGGWMVLNAVKYRDLVTADVRRQQTRDRVRRFRERLKGNASVTQGNEKLTRSEALALASASEDQEPRAGARSAPAGAASEAKTWTYHDVRSHLKAAAHAALDAHPTLCATDLAEEVKIAAARLGVEDYTSTRIHKIIEAVQAEREKRRA